MNPLRLPAFCLALACLSLLAPSLPAQSKDKSKDKSKSAESAPSHPAVKVVTDYLNFVLQREWKKSAALVEPASLDSLLVDFVRRVKGAPTMDDEEILLKRVGKSTLEEVEKMDPVDFYTAYHQGIQERWKVTDEAIQKVRESLKVRVLSVVEEDEKLTHVLVRTKHTNGKAYMENLELISLVKTEKGWKVGLNEQMPKITPVEGEAGNP